MSQRNQQLFERAQRHIQVASTRHYAPSVLSAESPLSRQGRRCACHRCRRKGLSGLCGLWGPLILGHAHPDIVKAVQEAAADGLSFGAPTGREVEMADLLCDMLHFARHGSARQLGHRGDDERDPVGTWIHRP